MKSGLIVTFLVITFAYGCKAQTAQDEINRDVWYPFIEAYNSFDAEAFMAIHTDDVVRVDRDGRNIKGAEEYGRSMRESTKRNIEQNAKRFIEFSFAERLHSGDTGYEVGYYRVTYAANELQNVFYGKFHVVLKKIDGNWKIAVDSDSSNGGTISEEDFISGQPLPER